MFDKSCEPVEEDGDGIFAKKFTKEIIEAIENITIVIENDSTSDERNQSFSITKQGRYLVVDLHFKFNFKRTLAFLGSVGSVVWWIVSKIK